MNDVSTLDILLYGAPVGTLTRLPGDRTIFAFTESYIADRERPTLGLSFKGVLGDLVTDFDTYQTQVMPFFSNLLPEGNMREYLAERAGVSPEREFFLLWALGKDLPGAISVQPIDGEEWPDEDEDSARGANDSDTALRFSLAGIQMKFSAVLEATGGLTIPAKGVGGDSILKLPSQKFSGVPENEYAMMSLARQLGMDVPEISLVPLDSIANLPEGIGELRGPALRVARFDRATDGSVIHIEDFAQVFGVYARDKYKKANYANIAKVIAIEGENKDVVEFIRRLTFNTLIGNADMHLKNWSLIYTDRIHAALAPAYDFVSTIAFLPDEKAALNFSQSKRFIDFSKDEMARLARKATLPEALILETIRETIDQFQHHWATEKKHLPISNKEIEAIENHVESLPLNSFR